LLKFFDFVYDHEIPEKSHGHRRCFIRKELMIVSHTFIILSHFSSVVIINETVSFVLKVKIMRTFILLFAIILSDLVESFDINRMWKSDKYLMPNERPRNILIIGPLDTGTHMLSMSPLAVA
jgi:FlaA1/EpsC-like NDP-sugar epimerase